MLTAYLLSASIFTPIMGRLGDMFGKERLLVLALMALTVGSLLSALSTSITVMLVGRVIQGVGGGVLPLAFGIIRDEFPQEKVAGRRRDYRRPGCRGCRLGHRAGRPDRRCPRLSLAVLAPHDRPGRRRGGRPSGGARIPSPDGRADQLVRPWCCWPGWLVALILGISEAPVWGWGSTSVVGLILLAVGLGVAWVFVESRSSHPLIDMQMMRIPAVWTTNLVALLLGVGMYAVFAFLPEFLQTSPSVGYGFGVSITHSGLILLPSSVFMFLFGYGPGVSQSDMAPRRCSSSDW